MDPWVEIRRGKSLWPLPGLAMVHMMVGDNAKVCAVASSLHIVATCDHALDCGRIDSSGHTMNRGRPFEEAYAKHG